MKPETEKLVRAFGEILGDVHVIDAFAALAFTSALIIQTNVVPEYRESAADDMKEGILAALADMKRIDEETPEEAVQ